MAIGQLLNPREKNIDDDVEVIIDEIAKAYRIGDRTHERDEEDVTVPEVGYSEAMQALQKNDVSMKSRMTMETVSRFRVLIDMKE